MNFVANVIARQLGVARVALRVIAVLAEHDELRISALAERAPLRVSALSRVLTGLERQGLAIRSHAARDAALGDHRAVAVSLTQAGRNLADRVRVKFREIEALLLAGFTAQERQIFIGLLRRMDDGIASVEARFVAETRRRRKR